MIEIDILIVITLDIMICMCIYTYYIHTSSVQTHGPNTTSSISSSSNNSSNSLRSSRALGRLPTHLEVEPFGNQNKPQMRLSMAKSWGGICDFNFFRLISRCPFILLRETYANLPCWLDAVPSTWEQELAISAFLFCRSFRTHSELTHLCQVNQSPSESISQIPWHSSFDNLWYCWYSVSIPYCPCCGTSICARAPPPWGTTASHWHGHFEHWRGPGGGEGQAVSPPCETTPKALLMDDVRGLKHLLPTGWKMATGNQTNGHRSENWESRQTSRLNDAFPH